MVFGAMESSKNVAYRSAISLSLAGKLREASECNIVRSVHLSNVQNPYKFHYTTDWFIGILKLFTMVYYNPHITGQHYPLYNLNNQVFFVAHVA